MSQVRVDVEGLQCMAGRCEEHAAYVSGVAALQPVVEAPGQLTAAAVGALHTSVATIGARLGARLLATSAAAQVAAWKYAETDAHGGDQINAAMH